MPTHFTLREAQGLIPEISGLLREAIVSRAEAAQAEREVRAATERIVLMGGMSVDTAAARELKNRLESAAARLRDSVESIQKFGCVVKDLETGLIDFPTVYRGQEALLCWKLGEPEIQFWHGAEEGFAGVSQSIRISASATARPKRSRWPIITDARTKLKLAISDAPTGRALLRRAGFRISKRRVLETNIVFDTPELLLRAAGRLLRVRTAGKTATLTYKGPGDSSRHKSREEVETTVADSEAMAAIASKVGFEPIFRYQKYRTEYGRADGGVATLDETPIGNFFELEGPPEWVDRVTLELGFQLSDQNTKSYGALYIDWCARKGVKPTNMEF